MFDASRQEWRLFCWLFAFVRAACLLTALVLQALAQGPTLTTISDAVYRADGNPASGTLLISWPAFTTAGGSTVAAGNLSVTLGTNGSFTAQLAPNAGATPAGTVYTVTYQLSDGTVKTETWSVGTTSPETISAVRTAAGTVTPAAQAATQQYVNAQLATVVHLSGTETVTGVKTFAVSPSLPTPAQAGDAATKGYVDSAVSNVGSGSYVSKTGDTMTGPLTLPGDPAAPLQAADKHYVDLGTAAKADLVSGIVPTAELGTGTANNGVCLHGDSTWGGCGTGSGPGLTAGMLAIKYATDFAWSQTPSNNLSAAGTNTITLTQCPAGVTGTEPYYYIYISGTGTAEAALVTGGTCAGNGLPGTLQFTSANSHSAGYTIGSASGGLQEALIVARFVPSNPTGTSQSGKVIVPPGEFKAYARVSIRASNITVDFSGSIVECWTSDSCLFLGDGLTTRFYLSQTTFTKSSTTIFDEEYSGSTLDPTRWTKNDPANAIVVANGRLQVTGGNSIDGATTVTFVENVELGGSWVIEHGDVVFTANVSAGVLGGLYLGSISVANCIAGFQISPAGPGSQIQALINGTGTGTALNIVSTHHYVLTTRIFSQDIYRQQQTFHCAANPVGSGIGGAQITADVRIVLEVQEIDPSNPATMVAPGIVLYDGVAQGAAAFCTYALVNSQNLYCAISFTRLIQTIDVEVRTALSGQPFVTRLVGPLSAGCECNVVSSTTLDFFSEYVPALNQSIEAHYRGQRGSALLMTTGRAFARVTNPASIASQQHGIDNGVRSAVRHVKSPPARTSADCENAALAILSDGATAGWTGKYEVWSDFLPGGAQDIFPGDALNVNVPSCSANFQAIVREVEITFADLAGEHSVYEIHFADDAAKTLSFEFETAKITTPINIPQITNAQVGTMVLPDLTSAQIVTVASTTVNIDAGLTPMSGGGIEVRWSDSNWGSSSDENLAGRFTTQTFTLPRLAKVQDYFLRQYDASSPPKYSRQSAALHIDFPF